MRKGANAVMCRCANEENFKQAFFVLLLHKSDLCMLIMREKMNKGMWYKCATQRRPGDGKMTGTKILISTHVKWNDFF